MRIIAVALWLTGMAVAAPVPPEPAPDPLAWGYIGVRVDAGTLRIASIEPGTPAAKAGLQAEDEFVKVGSLQPTRFEEVVDRVSTYRPGTLLKVTFRRGTETKEVTLRLGTRPDELPPPSRSRAVPAIPEP